MIKRIFFKVIKTDKYHVSVCKPNKDIKYVVSTDPSDGKEDPLVVMKMVKLVKKTYSYQAFSQVYCVVLYLL